MVKRNSYFLAGAVVVALALLVIPVSAVPAFTSITPSSGPIAGGNVVAIAGTGLANVTGVTFGGTPATSLTVTATQITATVPAHAAGAVTIIITAPEGTATASNAYTYASAPTISSITPTYGYNTSPIGTVSLSGTGFSTSPVPTVILRRSGSTNITGTSVAVPGPTAMTFTFDIVNKQAGLWDVIVRNPDGQYVILSNGFEIKSSNAAVTLTSITPSSSVTNKTVSITNLAGTGFSGTPQVYLKRTNYNNIYGTFSLSSSTKLTGSFNLTNCAPGTYQTCVENSGSAAVCGLSFVIQPMTATNGSLYITSSPSGAIVWVDNVNKGTTPVTVPVKVGSYVVKMQKTGYYDWAKRFEVTAGNETEVAATLSFAGAVTTTTTTKTPTIVITTATLPPTTVRTVPTSWAVPTAAAEESPVEIWIIVAAIAIGCIALRRK